MNSEQVEQALPQQAEASNLLDLIIEDLGESEEEIGFAAKRC